MSKALDAFRAVGIFNDHGFFGDQPYIWRRVTSGYRDVIPSAWRVSRRGEKLSTEWYDHGDKSFSYCGRDGSKEELAKAMKWASQRFGVKEWARTPFGSYGEASFVRTRIAELLAKAKAQPEEKP